MALERSLVNQLVIQLVGRCVSGSAEGYQERVRLVADELLVSQPTVQRWAEGRNLPCPNAGSAIIRHLRVKLAQAPTEREWTDTIKTFLERGDPAGRHERVRAVARVCAVSFPTVERWAQGVTSPHPIMMQAIYPRICDLLK